MMERNHLYLCCYIRTFFWSTTVWLYLGCLAKQKHTASLKEVERSWGDSSVGRVLDLQTEGPEFSSQNTRSWCGHVLVIPSLGRLRQAEPWGSLASQLSLLSKFQANGRHCLKKMRMVPPEWHLKFLSGLHMHTFICTHNPPFIHTHIHICIIHTHTKERKEELRQGEVGCPTQDHIDLHT